MIDMFTKRNFSITDQSVIALKIEVQKLQVKVDKGHNLALSPVVGLVF